MFSHFGSGSLLNVPTYLTRDFIVNPIKFREEYEELRKMGHEPIVYIDARAIVTTPWDMMLNQMKEQRRGNNRHGSCGFGINETVMRNRGFNCGFEFADIDLNPSFLMMRIFIGAEMEKLGPMSDLERQNVLSDDVMDRYLEDLSFMRERVFIVDERVLEEYETIVFEGAQGLELDQHNYKNFPHLTRSSTGLRNVTRMLWDMQGMDDVEVAYLSRCYVSKHGAGPLRDELPKPDGITVKDPTNVDNPHQGTLRFANLDLRELTYTINGEMSRNSHPKYKSSLVFTHMDCIDGDDFRRNTARRFQRLASSWRARNLYLSYGPDAKDVKKKEIRHD